jgi:hypothetical protein
VKNGVQEKMALHHSPTIVRNGLVLYLDAANQKSYPGTGTVWTDLSGNGNHFTLFNSPTFNNGIFTFDGINDYARSVNNINLSNTNAVTVEIIFNPLNYITGSGSFRMLMEATTNFNGSTVGFYTGYNDTGPGSWLYDISVNVKGDIGYNINAWDKNFITPNKWCFFTPILDKSISGSRETLLYTDSQLRTSASYVTGFNFDNTNNFGSVPIFIGSRNGSLNFPNIELSSVKIYNRALTAQEIQQNFNATRGRYGV